MMLIRRYIYLIPAAMLSLIFAKHAALAFTLDPRFIAIPLYVGIPADISHILVFAVGIVDTAIAILLLLRTSKLLLVYAALWPLIPAAILYLSGYFSSGYEIVMIFEPVFWAIITYLLWIKSQAQYNPV